MGFLIFGKFSIEWKIWLPAFSFFFQTNHFTLSNLALVGALRGDLSKFKIWNYGNLHIQSIVQIDEIHIYNFKVQKLQSFRPNQKVFMIKSNLAKGII